MLMNEVFDAFERGELELPCPKMELIQDDSEKPKRYRGSGIIRLNSERRLEFLMHPTEQLEKEAWMEILDPSVELGKLLPASYYYSLTATDWTGRIWQATRIDLDTGSGPGGDFVQGEIW